MSQDINLKDRKDKQTYEMFVSGPTDTSAQNTDNVTQADNVQSQKDSARKRNLAVWAVVACLAFVLLASVFIWSRVGETKRAEEMKAAEETHKEGEHNHEGREVLLEPEALQAAGLEYEGVTQRPAVALLKVTGTVETNQQQTQQITPLVSGRVERVNVSQGDRVGAGAVLAIISSPQIAQMHGKLHEAETRYALAQRNFERVQRAENRVAILQAKARLDEAEANLRRIKRLVEIGAGAGKDLIAAEAAYKTAKAEYEFQSNISLNKELQEAKAEVETSRVDVKHIRDEIKALGLDITEGESDDHKGDTSLVPLRASSSGIVTERLVNPGGGVEAGKTLFTISNIATVWVIANVPESQVGGLNVGNVAEIRSTGLGVSAISGRISYIDTRLNEEARTARVRVEVFNPGERLKAGMFVEVGFQTSTGTGAEGLELVVPSTAVQQIGEETFVFIPKEDEPGAFEVREVELGSEVNGYQKVLSGLALGEKVVTKGSFTLKTQMQKGQMGGHDH